MGYSARLYLPFLEEVDQLEPLVAYLPMMATNVFMIIVMFYFSRLYHQYRIFSRFDQARNIFGAVTIGAMMANGMQELFFKNTVFEVDYLRGMFFYVWMFSFLHGDTG